jgi:hypothetical protein
MRASQMCQAPTDSDTRYPNLQVSNSQQEDSLSKNGMVNPD